jgi:hypothetical protein
MLFTHQKLKAEILKFSNSEFILAISLSEFPLRTSAPLPLFSFSPLLASTYSCVEFMNQATVTSSAAPAPPA